MKRALLAVLACPSCGEGTLRIEAASEDGAEVRKGTITCSSCGAEYPVRAGMADMLRDPSPEVVREMAAWDSLSPAAAASEEERCAARERLLALPMLEGMEGPRGDMETWRRHGSAVFELCAGEDWTGRRVLEIGAGRCWLSAHLARLGAEVVAADILENEEIGLGCAEAFMEEGLFFERVLCDMHRLPFAEASFDAVVATATLHHSPRPDALLREIGRVLIPGGILLAANEPLFVPWRETPEEERKGAHEGAYPLWTWIKYILTAGFRVNRLEVGLDGSLRFRAAASAKGAPPAMSHMARATARYAALLAMAPPRRLLAAVRSIRAGWPMRPLPPLRSGYYPCRLGVGDIAADASAADRANWGPGWYAAEGDAEPFRWSAPRSRFILPPRRGGEVLALELATFHPSPRAVPTVVEVAAGGRKVGTITIDRHRWKVYRLEVPDADRNRRVTITLRVKRGYFIPREAGLGPDGRTLGVACRRAGWEQRISRAPIT